MGDKDIKTALILIRAFAMSSFYAAILLNNTAMPTCESPAYYIAQEKERDIYNFTKIEYWIYMQVLLLNNKTTYIF